MRALSRKLVDGLGSLTLASVLLALLGLLTWLGTLEQVHTGLYEVQRKYFESFVLVHRVGPVPLPLPGANLVLSLLFVNLLVGGVVRLRRDWTRAGILVAHLGIAVLLLSGFVKLYFSEDGHVTLFEGQRANWFQSYYRWEVVVSRELPDGRVEEHVAPQETFASALGARPAVLESPELPFRLELAHYRPNCRPLPKGPRFEVAVPVVDGVFLDARPRDAEAERNLAGVYARVVDRASGETRDGVLWGADAAPWTVEVGGERWAVDLRHERYPMPFTVVLDDFTKVDHPRMNMPKSFESDVTVIEGGAPRPVTISMNEPLRDGGLVLYQASWGPSTAGPGDRLFSTFSVVRNPADQMPLVGCLVLTAGLLLHFGRGLLRFVRRELRRGRGRVAGRVAPAARRAAGVAALTALALGAGAARADAALQDEPARMRTAPWSPRVVELAESLPVQDGGRVKPLHTFAGFTLLRLHGKRSLETPQGERLTPVEWLLDLLFFPEAAGDYPTFLVQNDEVIRALDLDLAGKRKRDRYSINELRPGIGRLLDLAHEIGAIDEKSRTGVQQQLIALAGSVDAYLRLSAHADYARYAVRRGAGASLEAIFGPHEHVAYSEVVEHGRSLRVLYEQLAGHTSSGEGRELAVLLNDASEVASGSASLALLPPDAPADLEEAWWTPADLLGRAFQGEPVDPRHLAVLRGFEALVEHRANPAMFEEALAGVHAAVTDLAAARGETGRVGLELRYYKARLLTWSLTLFLAAFLGLAALWLRPRSRVAYGLTSGLAAVGVALLVAAIAWRCVIRGRPPVSTLYETVLFVTAVGGLVALFVEWVGRQRIALSATVLLGAIGLFVANGYELLDKKDTMPSLVAVLDTNFWLATHVTTITIGYSAGMLAALLGSLYVLAKALGVRRADRAFFATLGRMVYGVLCFGLLFSLVGTILGGIWANDSWGRFWGWDPKENGALLICISQVLILHLRMAGHLREHGVCVAAAFGGTVVAFSWWGVNLLGVGLHSYGFTSGIHTALWTYYVLQWGVVALGIWTARRTVVAPAPAG